jgi:hypothetical protein
MTRVMPAQYGGRPSGFARVAFHLIEHLLHSNKFNNALRCRRQGIDFLVDLDPFGAPAGGRERMACIQEITAPQVLQAVVGQL